jgi:hypothetical protein
MLPDDVLLAIFDCYANEHDLPAKIYVEAWQLLVHVCRRWRSLVFGSARRLNLRLVGTSKTPVRDMLDVWPPFPLVVQGRPTSTEGADNIVAALERRDRVNRIELFEVNSSPLEIILAAMQEPFPELTYLQLWSNDEMVPVVPDSFLGRSGPRLVFLGLFGIPFPGLPKLLLSATHLVNLYLLNIPHSGYISPEAMVTALSTLTSLERLRLNFQSPQPHSDWAGQCPSPLTRTVVPVLTHFAFKGDCEYLDDLVACIDAPRLNDLSITFFHDIVFDAPQFIQFISRTPALEAFENARVVFRDRAAWIKFSSQTPGYGSLKVEISCRELDWQVSSLGQICTSCLPPLQVSASEVLYIYLEPFSHPHWEGNIEDTPWLELLHPFTGVKNLYLSKEFAPLIVPALQELIGGRTAEMWSTLQNIFLEGLQPSGPIQEGIGKFVAMRQLSGESGHPITVSLWERD